MVTTTMDILSTCKKPIIKITAGEARFSTLFLLFRIFRATLIGSARARVEKFREFRLVSSESILLEGLKRWSCHVLRTLLYQ